MYRRSAPGRHRAEALARSDQPGRISFTDALKSRIGPTAAVAFIGVASLTAFGVIENGAVGLYYRPAPVTAPPLDQSPNQPGQADVILGHETGEFSVQSLMDLRFGAMNMVSSIIANAGIIRTCSIDVDVEHSAISKHRDRSVARRIGNHIRNWIHATSATVSLETVPSDLPVQYGITEVSISGVGTGQSCPR